MKKTIFIITCLFCLSSNNAFSHYISISALYKTLNPKSISKHLAFYQLYPDTEEGKMALKDALVLLCQENPKDKVVPSLPKIDISSIIQIVNKNPNIPSDMIKDEDLEIINQLSSHLHNRTLPTHNYWDEEDFIEAKTEDIDLSRALFISEFGSTPEGIKKVKYYEACVDLMALQILATIGNNASDTDKIKAINDFIYFEMGFRYPPLSTFNEEIDSFSLLPSVIDRRKGICLGTSILYLAIAQRINLPLQSVTPPGHIFVRYISPEGKEINIETTARGINIPSDEYLNIETKFLQTRTNKEVVGLAFINQAALYLQDNNFEKAASLYERAKKYLPNDFLLKQLLGCCYLFIGKEEEGTKLLKQIKNITPGFSVSKDKLASDFLKKRVNIKGIKAIFIPYDDNRESILAKKEQLEKVVKKYPKFKMGQLLLAQTWLQLGRTKESFQILNNYYQFGKKDPIINFYLSVLAFERRDFKNAWKFLNNTTYLFEKQNYKPKTLSEFKEALSKACLE